MSNLSFFTHEFGDYEIRVVGDGRFSVYDVLVAFGAYPNLDTARITFRRLEKQNPEVSDFCSDFKFPGRGQRETPVTDEEGMYRILMLCPGKRGAEFRKWAAGIIADPDKALDHAVRKYKRMGWSDRRIRSRLEGKIARHKLTDTLKAHGLTQGWEYARCSDAVNINMLGQTAKEYKAAHNVQHTRDGMDDVMLSAYNLIEAKSSRDIENANAWGVDECERICSDISRKVKRILED